MKLEQSMGEQDVMPNLGDEGRVLEGVVTTVNDDGSTNISPMGPIVDEHFQWLQLRPFTTSTTYANLKRTSQGIFHVTDDVRLIAEAAVGQLDPLPELFPATKVNGHVLAGACRWYAFEAEWIDGRQDDENRRTTILARVVEQGRIRDFFGFNRAKHAVVEAAILATRVHLLSFDVIRDEFQRLGTIVEKTGAAEEQTAFEFLSQTIQQHVKKSR